MTDVVRTYAHLRARVAVEMARRQVLADASINRVLRRAMAINAEAAVGDVVPDANVALRTMLQRRQRNLMLHQQHPGDDANFTQGWEEPFGNAGHPVAASSDHGAGAAAEAGPPPGDGQHAWGPPPQIMCGSPHSRTMSFCTLSPDHDGEHRDAHNGKVWARATANPDRTKVAAAYRSPSDDEANAELDRRGLCRASYSYQSGPADDTQDSMSCPECGQHVPLRWSGDNVLIPPHHAPKMGSHKLAHGSGDEWESDPVSGDAASKMLTPGEWISVHRGWGSRGEGSGYHWKLMQATDSDPVQVQRGREPIGGGPFASMDEAKQNAENHPVVRQAMPGRPINRGLSFWDLTTSLRTTAHGSGDGETIYHCPMCGSGQVVGGSDGTTSCDFCGTTFTVSVQPEFSAMPQTVDGTPYPMPGMPGSPTDTPTGADAQGDVDQAESETQAGTPQGVPGNSPAPGSAPAGGAPGPAGAGGAQQLAASVRTPRGNSLAFSEALAHYALAHAGDNRPLVLTKVRAMHTGGN